MGLKIFTTQEANRRLPYVKKIVTEIIEKGKQLRGIQQDQYGNEKNPEVKRLQEEIDGFMKELEQLGCYYKDWNFKIGLVDFPAMIKGEAVFLCWRSDEPELKFYHRMEEGYDGRKLIPKDLLSTRFNLSQSYNKK